MDIFSKKIVGWISTKINSTLVYKSIKDIIVQCSIIHYLSVIVATSIAMMNPNERLNMDNGKFLTEVTTAMLNKQVDDIKQWLSSRFQHIWDSNIKSFKSYFKNSYNSISKTKTLLYKDKSIDFAKIYTNLSLYENSSNELVSDDHVVEKLLAGQKTLITATAGAGKSFFAKYLFISMCSIGKFVPVLIELRNIDNYSNSIASIIKDNLHDGGFTTTIDVVDELLRKKILLIILDGYDEIPPLQLEPFNKQLTLFNKKFTDIPLVITSRPDEQLEYLHQFSNYLVSPLNKTQAVNLIRKLEYDPEVKTKFIAELENELFDKHQDFSSNPLLLTIMLMTYSEIAEIPSKMHIFYEQAFLVLFNKHDSSKNLYKRKILTNLSSDDFKKMLACFSVCGYRRKEISFTRETLMNYISKAKQIAMLNTVDSEKFVTDLLKNVCILIQDGLRYTFNHRSFQEYFSACFLLQFPVIATKELYDEFLLLGSSDTALALAYEMNQDCVEREFAYPALCNLLNLCNNNWLKLLELYCYSINFTDRIDIYDSSIFFTVTSSYYPNTNTNYNSPLIKFIEDTIFKKYNMVRDDYHILLNNNDLITLIYEYGYTEEKIDSHSISETELELLSKCNLDKAFIRRLQNLQKLQKIMERRLNISSNKKLDDII